MSGSLSTVQCRGAQPQPLAHVNSSGSCCVVNHISTPLNSSTAPHSAASTVLEVHRHAGLARVGIQLLAVCHELADSIQHSGNITPFIIMMLHHRDDTPYRKSEYTSETWHDGLIT